MGLTAKEAVLGNVKASFYLACAKEMQGENLWPCSETYKIIKQKSKYKFSPKFEILLYNYLLNNCVDGWVDGWN